MADAIISKIMFYVYYYNKINRLLLNVNKIIQYRNIQAIGV